MKIYSQKKIIPIIKKIKLRKEKISLCHGVFDLLHIGHLKHFKEAKKNADILIISLTSDKFVNKGNNRPMFNQKLRAEALAAIEVVDYVIISNFKTAENSIKIVKPDNYIKGIDYKKLITKDISLKKELKTAKKFGAKITFTKSKKFSSSKIINNFYKNFSSEQKNYLKYIKINFEYFKIEKILDKLLNHKVTLFGDGIIDAIKYVNIYGRSSKDNFLVSSLEKFKEILGGSFSIANNISNFSNNLKFVSIIGKEKKLQKFIKNNLSKKIKFFPEICEDLDTIYKLRYIDNLNKNKLFGVYKFNNNFIKKKTQNRIKDKFLKLTRNKQDLIMIADFGHGLVDKELYRLKKNSKFISVNCQLNSTNRKKVNFDFIRNINLICINETELRTFVGNYHDDIEILAKKVLKKKNIKNMIVTRGKDGIIFVNDKIKTIKCPAFADEIVDKVGAGDTIFFLSSLLLSNKTDIKLTLFISSIAASMNITGLFNSESIKKDELIKNIKNYLL